MYSEVLNCCMRDVFPTPGDPMTTTLYTGAESGSMLGDILEGDTRDDHLLRLNKASFPGNKTTFTKCFQNISEWLDFSWNGFYWLFIDFFLMEYHLQFISLVDDFKKPTSPTFSYPKSQHVVKSFISNTIQSQWQQTCAVTGVEQGQWILLFLTNHQLCIEVSSS